MHLTLIELGVIVAPKFTTTIFTLQIIYLLPTKNNTFFNYFFPGKILNLYKIKNIGYDTYFSCLKNGFNLKLKQDE